MAKLAGPLLIALLSPSYTTRSSVNGFAKATTPEPSWLATPLLLPPEPESPQVTTEPSLFRAAKANPVEKICTTP
ncbi:MAG: hypothetical protein VKI83_04570, partial [Synechococcaceae cyanobacterium]|nr:hypothetical protein [Synechococcaceae cyanobacterium]